MRWTGLWQERMIKTPVASSCVDDVNTRVTRMFSRRIPLREKLFERHNEQGSLKCNSQPF